MNFFDRIIKLATDYPFKTTAIVIVIAVIGAVTVITFGS